MDKAPSRITLDYEVCGRCGRLFDDQGENGWWLQRSLRGRRATGASSGGLSRAEERLSPKRSLWWHDCDDEHPARVIVRKLPREA